MRIDGPSSHLTMVAQASMARNAARAYGPASTSNGLAVTYGQSPESLARVTRPDQFQPSIAARNLVAATVPQPIEFDHSARATAAGQAALRMYTRAADRIEAAVAIQLGRSIDLKG